MHRQLGLARNRLERHVSLTSRSLEDGFDERHEADFLTEEVLVVVEDRLAFESQVESGCSGKDTHFLGQTLAQDLVLADIAGVKDEQQILKPLVWRVFQDVEQRMLQLGQSKDISSG